MDTDKYIDVISVTKEALQSLNFIHIQFPYKDFLGIELY